VSCWNYSDVISDIKKWTNAQIGKNWIESADALFHLRRDLEWNTKFHIMPEVAPGLPTAAGLPAGGNKDTEFFYLQMRVRL
jgi:hypothetical protein